MNVKFVNLKKIYVLIITMKVRERLCKRCNLAMGMFEDNINIMESAIVYLNNTR